MNPPDKKRKTTPEAPGMIAFPWHAEARTILSLGRPPMMLLAGEPGVGKSRFARAESIAATGQEPIILSGSPEVEESHFFGRWTLDGQSTRFVDGPLPMALKTSRWLVVEEFSQIAPETRACLMPLRDQGTVTNPLTGEVIPVPDAFRLIATSNAESLTCRKNTGVARVLYDGFIVLEAPDLNDEQVLAVLRFEFPKLSKKTCERARDLWNEYREFDSKGSSGKSYLSVRAVEHFLRLRGAGLSEERAVQIAFVNKFLTGDRDLFSAARLKASMSSAEGGSSDEA